MKWKWKIYRWKAGLNVHSWKRGEYSLPRNGQILFGSEALELLVQLNSGKEGD